MLNVLEVLVAIGGTEEEAGRYQEEDEYGADLRKRNQTVNNECPSDCFIIVLRVLCDALDLPYCCIAYESEAKDYVDESHCQVDRSVAFFLWFEVSSFDFNCCHGLV